MNLHLSDEQLTDWLLDEARADMGILAHLRECALCRSEAEGIRASLKDFRATVENGAALAWAALGHPPAAERLPMNGNGHALPLSLLPEQHTNWRSVTTSYGLQIVAVALLVNIGMLLPGTIKLISPSVAQVIQLMDVPKPQRPAVRPPKELMPPPPKVETPPLEEPKLVAELKMVKPIKPVAKPEPEETKAPEIKEPDMPKNLPTPDTGSPKVKIVHTNTALSTGSQAAPTMKSRPAEQVQTGGFGDPFGVKGVGKAGAHLTISQGGPGSSFDLPEGPGYGNGTGGKKGAKGIIPSSGFGNGTATGNAGSTSGGGGGGHHVVADTGLNNAVAEVRKPATPAEEKQRATPVHIISKPTPVYTEEARQLKIEGDVQLEVVFLASGNIQVVRVVQGLGHGLDEAAVRAAQQIKFTPAMTADGQPLDFGPAKIKVSFQVAY